MLLLPDTPVAVDVDVRCIFVSCLWHCCQMILAAVPSCCYFMRCFTGFFLSVVTVSVVSSNGIIISSTNDYQWSVTEIPPALLATERDVSQENPGHF